MASNYPTLRRSAASSFQGAARPTPVVPSRPQEAPRRGQLLMFPYERSNKRYARFQGPSGPYIPPFGVKPRQVQRLARDLFPGLQFVRAWELAEQLNRFRGEEDSLATAYPGAGFTKAAECFGGGPYDRVWNTSPVYPFPSPGPINACQVSTAFFPGAPVDATTRSYGLVQSRPLPGLPDRAQGILAWQRPNQGPINKGRIEFNPELYPEALPQAFPLLAPLKKPIGDARPKPLRANQIRRLGRMAATNPWVQRQSGPAPVLGSAILYKPFHAISIGAGGLKKAPPHKNAPPKGRTKDRKLRGANRTTAAILLNAVTETKDFVEALHSALPPELRRSRQWVDKSGNLRKRSLTAMLRDLFQGWNQLDLETALGNVVANQIEDFVIGRINQAANKNTGAAFGTTGVHGAGTRVAGGGMKELGAFSWVGASMKALGIDSKEYGGNTQSAYRAEARAAGRAASYQRSKQAPYR